VIDSVTSFVYLLLMRGLPGALNKLPAMRLLSGLLFLTLLCACDRSPLPKQWRGHMLKIQVYSDKTSEGGEINFTENLPGRGLRVGPLGMAVAGMADAQNRSAGVWCDLAAVSPEGVLILVHTGYNSGGGHKILEQKVSVPYDKPTKVTLIPGVFFEARFDSVNPS
jgi:hypothetical protein